MPLGKYIEIKNILLDGTAWTEQQPRLIAIINDMTEDEVLNLKLHKYQELTSTLDFLKTPPVPSKCPRKIVLNNKSYYVERDSHDLSAAQFLDYQNYMSLGDDSVFPNVLSIFIIPEGKNYGEYDVMEVIEDIENYLTVDVALGIFGFFHKAFLKYIRRTLLCSETLMVMMRKKEQTEEMKKALQTAEAQIAYLRSLVRNGDFLFSSRK